MKKLIVMGIVAAMVMGLSVAACAAVDTDWTVQLRAINGTTSQGTITIGTKATAVDAVVSPTEDTTYPSPTAGYAEISITNGAVTRMNKDYRAPIDLVANAGLAKAKVWNLVMGINGGAPGQIKLIGWAASTFKIDGTDTIVELYQGANKLFTFAPGTSGTSTAPSYTGFLEYAGSPMDLQLVAYAPNVPEPGSILALMSGMVGLVGYGIRRRK